MTTKHDDVNLTVFNSPIFYIDWGDGYSTCNFEEVSQNAPLKIRHIFMVSLPRTITIYRDVTNLKVINNGLTILMCLMFQI